jgi:hypothetical protein
LGTPVFFYPIFIVMQSKSIKKRQENRLKTAKNICGEYIFKLLKNGENRRNTA